MSPVRAILLHSPGRKPWVIIVTHLLSPKGAALFCLRQMLALLVPLLVGAQSAFAYACTQGFISGFALIPPWAMQEYRA